MPADQGNEGASVLSLTSFVADFGESLIEAVRIQNPPIFDGSPDPSRDALMDQLTRKPFEAQRNTVQAVAKLLVDEGEPSAIINAEMGTGKTMMAIACAHVLHHEGYERALVVCPPHLVYKWRREIMQTVPGAKVWILNGPDTLRKLLQLRLVSAKPSAPEFYVMGRVRMRMGFNWKPAFATRMRFQLDADGVSRGRVNVAICPDCGTDIVDKEADGETVALSPMEASQKLNARQMACTACGGALWTLTRGNAPAKSRNQVLMESLTQLPTIGPKTADKLVSKFGPDMLSGMLEDNVYDFIQLMDDDGEFYFSDRQARRMERKMANMEFSFGTGGYQPTEFIKRYLPSGFFGVLIADEGHEFKNDGSAQGQAFGVLASQCKKSILLTGTLMGGYADDLFYLLFRLNPGQMVKDGFRYIRGSLGSAGMSFMRSHGVIKDIYKMTSGRDGEVTSHRTAKGKQVAHHTARGPGFGPQGIMRYVLPITVFLKLKDIGSNVLPPYQEFFTGIDMTEEQAGAYNRLSLKLKQELSQALRCGDKTLLGVVLNALLAWPDCCFRSELVYHPRKRVLLASQSAVFTDEDVTPKEQAVVDLCRKAKQQKRRTLVYSVYTGTRDTTSRMKSILEREGFNVAVLRASVDAAQREDWLMEQVDRNVDVIITNPELVKTGLDMLEFPTIVFMQSGWNVYTLQQASRRSWRIGQRQPVEVHFLGYLGTAQMSCLELMSKKIAVSQSTSGDMPDSGLDVLNQSGDSIEVALAKQMLA
ncbi:hypothetical protein JY96_21170 [Aquabacterium sp. NJ1]|nr:hypothetical protein JY96_21170 [Aquabacterium sp. NJ1]